MFKFKVWKMQAIYGADEPDWNKVLLQAMKEDPPLEAKCRDKFLVQSVAIPADKDVENVSQIV